MTLPSYCTREDVKSALDSKESARNNGQIDRAIGGASRSIEGLLRRVFYPTTGTRYFDWPNYQSPRPWRLWLGRHELISVSSLTAGGTTIDPGDYYLEPVNDGPPYTRIEINLATSAAFTNTANTWQRAVAVAGVFGYCADTAAAGTLAAAVSSTSATTMSVSNSAAVGVGDLLLVDSEQMVVVEKTMASTSQTLQTVLTAANSATTVAVTTGSSYAVGEVLLLDSERMLVVDVSGNNLTVRRAWDGTTLAAHTGSTIYAPRTLTVVRATVGTTAATHTQGTAVYRNTPPGLIRQLGVAESVNTLLQETSGYARTIGSGDHVRNASGTALPDLREQAEAAYGRRVRTEAI